MTRFKITLTERSTGDTHTIDDPGCIYDVFIDFTGEYQVFKFDKDLDQWLEEPADDYELEVLRGL
jgi:hypothetical protein